jgi:hypothetical protein
MNTLEVSIIEVGDALYHPNTDHFFLVMYLMNDGALKVTWKDDYDKEHDGCLDPSELTHYALFKKIKEGETIVLRK